MGDGMKIEGERSKRYGLSYRGVTVGSYDTAKELLEQHRHYEDVVRPTVDPKRKGRYRIRDGNKEITLAELRRAVEREEQA
jgi:hypothetical protein